MSVDGRVELLARFLKQQSDLGEPELFLPTLTRIEALSGVRPSSRDSLPVVPEFADMRLPKSAGPESMGKESVGVASTSDSGRSGHLDSEDRSALDYESLRSAASGCERCSLAQNRTQVVFSDGHPDARLMVVGEAPGATEDATGVPFVGQAGKMLDLLLASVGLSRSESVYICNVLKCRPPGNRNPTSEEIELCSPFLRRQISLVKPEVILAVGTFSGQLLTGNQRPLGKLRGEVYSYEGVPLVVTYHPAALLRNAGWTRATWDDFQLLRKVMDG